MVRTTEWVVIVAVVGLVLYDLVAMVRSGPDATISVIVHEFSKNNPIVPLAVGIVIGHIFWPVGGGRR